jgi:hypothetical protein
MPGFTSYDDLINETTTNGKTAQRPFFKVSSAPEVAGQVVTLWKAAGLPGAGADAATTPGTAYTSTAGGITLQNEASDYKYLLRAEVTANQNCTLLVLDRLVSVSGLSIASTGDKTVSSTTLPTRASSGVNVEALLELTTATTANVAVVSMNSYTNTAPTGGRVGGSVTFNAAAQNIDSAFFMPLAAGDVGITAVSTINVGTAGTSGICALTLVQRVAQIPLIANIGTVIDFTRGYPPMPRILDGDTLMLAIVAGGTSATTVQGVMTFGWG